MSDLPGSDLSDRAKRHLWMHFTRLGAYADSEVPIISRGEGCYVWDHHGKRYLDGLSGLFTVQVGHGRAELGEAAAGRPRRSGTSRCGPSLTSRRIELATRLAALAPGDLNRVFLTPSGGEAIDTAIKLARQYFKLRGAAVADQGDLAVPRLPRHFDRGAQRHRRAVDQDAVRAVDARRHQGADAVSLSAVTIVSISTRARCAAPTTSRCASRWKAPSQSPRCSWSRCRTPAVPSLHLRDIGRGIREICDQYGVLLVSDEVICAFGRLGHMFGSDRYGYQPDLITFAKGVTSGYAPLGGVMVSDRIAEPFLDDPNLFLHGQTFGAHPVCCAVANANLDILEREDLCGNVLKQRGQVHRPARRPTRHSTGGRRSRRRLLPGDRAGQRSGHQGIVHSR